MGSCAAVVLGSYVNAYNIVRELHNNSVKDIILLDDQNKFTRYSNLISERFSFDDNSVSLLLAIKKIKRRYEYLVLFPTSDDHLLLLNEIYDQISNYSYIPFNQNSLKDLISKENQYKICKRLNIPCPEYKILRTTEDLSALIDFEYPILIKPATSVSGFRNKLFNSYSEFEKSSSVISKLLGQGIEIICSEVIPGDDSAIFAYTACVSRNNEIINSWTGRKLSQHPDNFGVFSSAIASNVPEVKKYGEMLIKEMCLYGIVEPEFKYDARSGTYFLMEINLRSMMWHRVGTLSGINLHYNQWQIALNNDVKVDAQSFVDPITLVYMKHEISNIFCRAGYLRKFIFLRLTSNEKWSFAVYNTVDPVPALVDFLDLPKLVVKRWLKAFINTFSKK